MQSGQDGVKIFKSKKAPEEIQTDHTLNKQRGKGVQTDWSSRKIKLKPYLIP